MKSNKKNYKSKRKTRSQMGGGWKFWKQILTGRLFGVGGPSKPRSKPRSKSKSRSPPKSRSKSNSKSKSKSSPKNRLSVKPKVRSEVDILFEQYKKLTLDQSRVNKLSKKDYQKLVDKITEYNEKKDRNSDYNFN